MTPPSPSNERRIDPQTGWVWTLIDAGLSYVVLRLHFGDPHVTEHPTRAVSARRWASWQEAS